MCSKMSPTFLRRGSFLWIALPPAVNVRSSTHIRASSYLGSPPLPFRSFQRTAVEGWQVCGLGRSSDGWILHTHAHKPQRFQLFLENLMLSVGPDRIMSPTNFGMELTLHRFKVRALSISYSLSFPPC